MNCVNKCKPIFDWDEFWYDRRIENQKQIITCECGCSIRKDGLSKHKRSKKHMSRMNNKRIEYQKIERESIKGTMCERYKQNKDKHLKKIHCECGSIVTRNYKSTHKLSNKHQQFINSLSNNAITQYNIFTCFNLYQKKEITKDYIIRN